MSMIPKKDLLARMIEKAKGTKWYMAGTESTGRYVVLASSKVGRVGFRVVGNYIRVRIEPNDSLSEQQLAEKYTPEAGWKQPSHFGQYRFSRVFNDPDEAIAAIELAVKEIGRDSKVERQPGTRRWRLALRRAHKKFTQAPVSGAIPAT